MRLRVENMLNKKGLGILCAIAVFMLAACKDPNNVGIGYCRKAIWWAWFIQIRQR